MELLLKRCLLCLLACTILLPPVNTYAGTVPRGTEFRAELLNPINWSNAKEGSSFSMKLTGKPVIVNKQILIPDGSKFHGNVSKSQLTPSKIYTVLLRLDQLELPNGQRFAFNASLAMSPGGKKHDNESLKRLINHRGEPVGNLTVANKKDEYIMLVRDKQELNIPAGTIFIMNVGKNIDLPSSVGKLPDTIKLITPAMKTIQFRNGKIMHAEILDFSRNTEMFMMRHDGDKKEYHISKIRMINFADDRVDVKNDNKKLQSGRDTIILKNGKIIHGKIVDISERTMTFEIRTDSGTRNIQMDEIARMYMR